MLFFRWENSGWVVRWCLHETLEQLDGGERRPVVGQEVEPGV